MRVWSPPNSCCLSGARLTPDWSGLPFYFFQTTIYHKLHNRRFSNKNTATFFTLAFMWRPWNSNWSPAKIGKFWLSHHLCSFSMHTVIMHSDYYVTKAYFHRRAEIWTLHTTSKAGLTFQNYWKWYMNRTYYFLPYQNPFSLPSEREREPFNFEFQKAMANQQELQDAWHK